jgi:hypothetical protein
VSTAILVLADFASKGKSDGINFKREEVNSFCEARK